MTSEADELWKVRDRFLPKHVLIVDGKEPLISMQEPASTNMLDAVVMQFTNAMEEQL